MKLTIPGQLQFHHVGVVFVDLSHQAWRQRQQSSIPETKRLSVFRIIEPENKVQNSLLHKTPAEPTKTLTRRLAYRSVYTRLACPARLPLTTLTPPWLFKYDARLHSTGARRNKVNQVSERV